MHDFGGGWMAVGLVFMVVFWGGIIALVVWGIKRFTHTNGHTSGKSPIDIIKERYAKGEITKEQYEQMKKEL
jgi:putative membrane protein